MKKQYALCGSLILILITVIGLCVFSREAKDPDTLIVVVIDTRETYLYSIDCNGILSSASGYPKKRNSVRSVDDFSAKQKEPAIYDDIHLPETDVQRLVAFADRAVEFYDSYRDHEVRDACPVTLYYQGEEYHGYYTAFQEFSTMRALCDALIELSPMPIEFPDYA